MTLAVARPFAEVIGEHLDDVLLPFEVAGHGRAFEVAVRAEQDCVDQRSAGTPRPRRRRLPIDAPETSRPYDRRAAPIAPRGSRLRSRSPRRASTGHPTGGVHGSAEYIGREEFPSGPPSSSGCLPSTCASTASCPLAVEDGALVVACADPTDPTVVDELRSRPGARCPPGRRHGDLDPRGDRAVLRRGIAAGQKVVEAMGRTIAGRGERRGRDIAPGHGVRRAGGPARQPPSRERDQSRRPPRPTSSRSRTRCGSGTGSTACSSTPRRRRDACRRP